MRKEKAYNLLSGLLDNELSVDKRFKILQEIEKDSWCKNEYNEMKKLKETISSVSSTKLLTSPNFETNLKNKIYNKESHESWLNKLMYTGILPKVSYGMVAASAMFILFVGIRFYNQDGAIKANYSTDIASKIPAQTKIENNLLTIQSGNDSVRINLETGRPYSELDYKKLSQFSKYHVEDKLVSLGFKYMKKGEYDISKALLRAFALKFNKMNLPFENKELINNGIKRVNNK